MKQDEGSNVGITNAFVEDRGVHVIVLDAFVALSAMFEVLILFRKTDETNLLKLTYIF